MSGEELVEVLKALADPVRLTILRRLEKRSATRVGPVEAGEAGLCASDVESAVGLSQAAVSHHMAILTRAGLAIAEKRGRWTFYRRNNEALETVASALFDLVRATRSRRSTVVARHPPTRGVVR